MKKLTDLTFLFTVVTVVEVAYALVTLAPPAMLGPATGWVLNADGQWVTKLLCVALASQAAVAWSCVRRHPPGSLSPSPSISWPVVRSTGSSG
jgi:hypothetical protein